MGFCLSMCFLVFGSMVVGFRLVVGLWYFGGGALWVFV